MISWLNNRIIDRYFWVLNLVFLSFISFLSYGFVKDLYFWRDDYAFIYLFQKRGFFRWPYQGAVLEGYPFYFLFHENPRGYFIAELVLFVVASFLLSYFIYKISRSKITAFLSGLIFASGYIGSETMIMSMVGITSLSYIIGSTLLIFLWIRYGKDKSFWKFLMIFVLYCFLVLFFSQRAHSLILLLLVSGLYVVFPVTWKFFTKNIGRILKDIFPFLIVSLVGYILLGQGSQSSQGVLYIIQYFLNSLSIKTVLIFFSNLGSFLFPSSLVAASLGRNEFLISSLIGVFLTIILFSYLFFSKIPIKEKKLGIFLTFLWIASYITYFLYDPTTLLYSSQRYLIFGYFFFVAVLAVIFKNVFFAKKRVIIFRLVGSILVVFLVIFHINQILVLREQGIKRNQIARKFFSDIRREIPLLKGKSLFFFDIASDSNTESNFWETLRVGVYGPEAVLATFYKSDLEDIRIVEDYPTFLKEKNSGKYNNSYLFFYTVSGGLVNVNRLLLSNHDRDWVQVDLSKVRLYEKYVNDPEVRVDKNNSLVYKPIIAKNQKESRSINGILQIDVGNRPSFTTTRVHIEMKVRSLISQITQYPYLDESATAFLKNFPIELIHDVKYRQNLLNYIKARFNFRSLAKISSSEAGKGKEALNVFDGKIATSWEPNKRAWLNDKQSFLKIDVPHNFKLSQIRFVSLFSSRLPISYEYQVLTSSDGKWKTIYKVENSNISPDEYVVDTFTPVEINSLKMIIYKTPEGDFPSISEIELLNESYNVDSKLADFLLEHPLVQINGNEEKNEIIDSLEDYLTMNIYPLSDKYLLRDETIKISSPIFIDNKYHSYNISLPPGGTKLNGFVIKFPNIPVEVTITKILIRSD